MMRGAQSPTNTGSGAAGPALALVGVGARYWRRRKHIQSHFGVKHFELAVAAVDDILHTIESERCFCDVGGDDDLKGSE